MHKAALRPGISFLCFHWPQSSSSTTEATFWSLETKIKKHRPNRRFSHPLWVHCRAVSHWHWLTTVQGVLSTNTMRLAGRSPVPCSTAIPQPKPSPQQRVWAHHRCCKGALNWTQCFCQQPLYPSYGWLQFIVILLLLKYSCLHFLPTTPPNPSHPHLPPLIPPPTSVLFMCPL